MKHATILALLACHGDEKILQWFVIYAALNTIFWLLIGIWLGQRGKK